MRAPRRSFVPLVLYELHRKAYAIDMPRPGERIRGRQRMREFQDAYPAGHKAQTGENLWMVEGVSDYGGNIYHPVVIIELRDGKIRRDTCY